MAKNFKTDMQSFGAVGTLIDDMQGNNTHDTHNTHNTHSVYDTQDGQNPNDVRQKRVDITLHPELIRKGKELAYNRRLSFSGLITDLLENELIKEGKE